MVISHPQLSQGHDWLLSTLDADHVRFTKHRGVFDESGSGLTEHHPRRRSDRLHPLSHPGLLTDSGVTERPRTDLTGYHLSAVQAHAQPKVHTVAILDLGRKPLGLLLNARRGQAGPHRVILQRHRRTKHGHDAQDRRRARC
jgi:hypothetical protein